MTYNIMTNNIMMKIFDSFNDFKYFDLLKPNLIDITLL